MKPIEGTMSHVTETKIQDIQRPRTKSGLKTQRPPVWRPQPSSLTRDELRQIVLDTLG